mmetsp:Transcript_53590/g.121890  ORF Transcript_53590/g.121890 Transcript_53590/m.121890 type:complete len:391 (-) Transcript_53590:103-1275(-)
MQSTMRSTMQLSAPPPESIDEAEVERLLDEHLPLPSTVTIPSRGPTRRRLRRSSSTSSLGGQKHFEDTDAANAVFLKDVKKIFEKVDADHSGTITMREFIQAMPWVNRNYPFIARHMRTIDEDQTGTLDWDEWVQFCKSDRVQNELKRANIMTTHDICVEAKKDTRGRTHPTHKLFKNMSDPILKCEVAGTCSDIHHQGHRVEWRVDNIKRLIETMPPGKFVTSPVFAVAGISGMHMKFWPVRKDTIARHHAKKRLAVRFPDGWSEIALFAPPGTHFWFRFFIGQYWSPHRECYWSDACIESQRWEPPRAKPPEFLESDSLVIGVEINQNLRSKRLKRPDGSKAYRDRSLCCALPEMLPPHPMNVSLSNELKGLTGTLGGATLQKSGHGF